MRACKARPLERSMYWSFQACGMNQKKVMVFASTAKLQTGACRAIQAFLSPGAQGRGGQPLMQHHPLKQVSFRDKTPILSVNACLPTDVQD